MKTFLKKSTQQMDEWGTAIYIQKGYHKQSSKVSLCIELYYIDSESDYENGMDFYFQREEDVDEFIKDLIEMKEDIWPKNTSS